MPTALLHRLQESPNSLRANPKVKHFLLLALLVAAGLRFALLDFFGFSSDEFATLMIVSKPSFQSVLQTSLAISQPMPPLYFVLNKVAVAAFGSRELGLRFLSAVCSLGIVYLIFLIGRTLFNSQVAIAAAALCTLNTTQILYAQTARPYALALLFSSSSILFFLNWLKNDTPLNRFSYVISTSLLLHTHYLFSPLLIVQTFYFFWFRRFAQARGCTKKSWRNWLLLQSMVGLIVLPLVWQGQVLKMIQGRGSLAWVSYKPRFEDIVPFFKTKYLFFSLLITSLLWLATPFRKRLLQRPLDEVNQEDRTRFSHGLTFLLAWYGIPLFLFWILYCITGINLFVERYLLLSSLSPCLLIPAAALFPRSSRWGKTFVIVYVVYYGVSAPVLSYVKKGHFAQASPGENQWRDALGVLNDPVFQSSQLLFQSPYIEADQLKYSPNTPLFDYLSAPLGSFYLHERPRGVHLLPHHWRATAAQATFRASIKGLIVRDSEFTLLCDEEFWQEFQPWLQGALSDRFELLLEKEFHSKQGLRLMKITLVRLSAGPTADCPHSVARHPCPFTRAQHSTQRIVSDVKSSPRRFGVPRRNPQNAIEAAVCATLSPLNVAPQPGMNTSLELVPVC